MSRANGGPDSVNGAVFGTDQVGINALGSSNPGIQTGKTNQFLGEFVGEENNYWEYDMLQEVIDS